MILTDKRSSLFFWNVGDENEALSDRFLEVNEELSPEVAVVKGELDVAVVQVAGNGFAT